MIMFSRNPTGVAVQLVKWYQYMALCWQLNDRLHIQIFRGVHLDSYTICDLWSAVLQPQVIPYSGLKYFSTLSLTDTIFWRNIFCHKVCVLIFSTTFVCNIFIVRKVDRELIKNIRKSSCQRAVFLVRFTRNLNFPDRHLKNIQVPIFMKFVQYDRRTDRHGEANSCFSQFDAPNKESFFCPFLSKHRKCQ